MPGDPIPTDFVTGYARNRLTHSPIPGNSNLMTWRMGTPGLLLYHEWPSAEASSPYRNRERLACMVQGYVRLCRVNTSLDVVGFRM